MKNKENKRELIKMITYVDTKEIIKEIKLLAEKMWKHEWENGFNYSAYLIDRGCENGLRSIDNECANNFIKKETSHLIKESKDKIEILFLKLENNQNKEIIKEIQWLMNEASSCQYLSGGESARMSSEDLLIKHLGECSRNHYKIVDTIDKLFEKIGEQNE